VTSRGDRQKPIFEDDEDRLAFLKMLAEVAKRLNWLCHAYCLMANHYHLVVETPEGNLSKGMRRLDGMYPQASTDAMGERGVRPHRNLRLQESYPMRYIATMLVVRQTVAYAEWFSGLRDRTAKTRIDIRIRRLALGNPGDVKPVGEGVSTSRELRPWLSRVLRPEGEYVRGFAGRWRQGNPRPRHT